MINSYTIEVSEIDEEVKAKIYLGKDNLGTVWVPQCSLKSKRDYQKLFESIGNIIYGQETKATKKEQSDCKVLAALVAQSSSRQEE